jgi:glutamate/tyrosine decarboxylase-like PLP-dependent enzyme
MHGSHEVAGSSRRRSPQRCRVRRPQLYEAPEIVSYVAHAADAFLRALPYAPVRSERADEAAEAFGGPLPEDGDGGLAAVGTLLSEGLDAAVRSPGPRFFHFVVGGSTPAALGADWVASLLDQNATAWVASPLGSQLEVVALGWLRELFGLPSSWGGVLTTGAHMANFTALACARRWWAERLGIDVDERGLHSLPQMPVMSSGYVHASVRKALAMLGVGRTNVQLFARDAAGRLDLQALRRALEDLGGAPAVLVANAGEVNTGDFDPIAEMADLASEHDAWLHVDGAFGLFASVSPRTKHLVEGIDRAQSVISDGHKWLNVPYDCGFAFVSDPALLGGAFTMSAAYLENADAPRPNLGLVGPESSRRARGLVVWATLRAYGRSGYRVTVERHLELAQRVAARVDDAPELERLAEVPLNIVCFRLRRPGLSENALDDLNHRLGNAILEDGRVFVGTTVYEGRVALRPAIVNWMTTDRDVDLLVDVVREVGNQLP